MQFAERLSAADGDYRLLGEGFQQLRLRVRKAAGFTGSDEDGTDRGIVT